MEKVTRTNLTDIEPKFLSLKSKRKMIVNYFGKHYGPAAVNLKDLEQVEKVSQLIYQHEKSHAMIINIPSSRSVDELNLINSIVDEEKYSKIISCEEPKIRKVKLTDFPLDILSANALKRIRKPIVVLDEYETHMKAIKKKHNIVKSRTRKHVAHEIIMRTELASYGFTKRDQRLADVLQDETIPERLWLAISENGDVLIYIDCGNEWIQPVCDTILYTPLRGE